MSEQEFEDVTEDVTEETTEEVTDYSSKYGEDVVAQARMWGWKPPEEWQGELPATYIDDPERWIERASTNPAVKGMQEQLQKIESALTAQNRRQQQQHAERLKQIEARKAEAEKEGDFDTYVALDKQEDQLRQSAPQEEGVGEDDKKVMDRWAAERPWISDPVKNAAASALWNQARAQNITDLQAILTFVDSGMKQQFADLQPKPEPKATQPRVGAGLVQGGAPSAFSKLPKDAKASFEKFYSQGAYGDIDKKAAQAQYAEDYENG